MTTKSWNAIVEPNVSTPGRVLCAWHSMYFPAEPVPDLGAAPAGCVGDSHGMCERCQAAYVAELVEVKAPTPAQLLRGAKR